MAFVKVEAPEEEFDEGAEFVRLPAIGDTLMGLYITKVETADNFNPGKKRMNYKFKGKKSDGSMGTLIFTVTRKLKADLDKAEADGLLKPGRKVVIKKTAERDIGKDNPMPVYELLVDDGKPTAGKPAGQSKPAPKPTPAPAADDFSDFDDDVPF